MTSSHDAPPDHLDTPLHLDPGDWRRRDVYRLMTSLVVPRPIAWISTRGLDGVANLAPHSYFMMVSARPAHVAFSSTGVKDTLTNVRDTGVFVVNFVSRALTEAMNATSIDLPADRDEFAWAGLEAGRAATIDAPTVAGAKAHLECRFVRELEVGDSTLVIGEVTHVRVDPDVWGGHGTIDVHRLDPVGRLSGAAYTALGEVFELRRPRWEDVAEG